jgi:DNA-binding NarL/FixJ family response regulator
MLNFVADGLTDIEIGQKLELSPKTINHRIECLKRQLNVKTRMQVVVTALRNKWIF